MPASQAGAEVDRATAGTAPERLPLSSVRIVDTALRLIDRDCLTELSMRRLGAELGVEAMSLYRYFPSKAALLDAAVCQVLRDAPAPRGDETDWVAAARGYAHAFRGLARQHPHLFPFLATAGGDTRRDLSDRMHRVWRRAGLTEADAILAQAALDGYVTGASLRDATGDAPEGSADTFDFGLDALLRGLAETVARAPKVPVDRGTPVRLDSGPS